MALKLLNRNKQEEKAEMSFIDHLEVLRGHLFRSVVAIAIGAGLIAYFNKFFVRNILMGPTHSDFATYSILCRAGRKLGFGDSFCMKEIDVPMQSTSVSGQFSMFFTVILVGGLIIAFPYVFWEF
jgi:sec-independent protein translocase protein TatC